MNHKAAALHDAGRAYGSEANMAKLMPADAAAEMLEEGAPQADARAQAAMPLSMVDGMGYRQSEMHLERLWRDARLFRFAPVSEEMILNYMPASPDGAPSTTCGWRAATEGG